MYADLQSVLIDSSALRPPFSFHQFVKFFSYLLALHFPFLVVCFRSLARPPIFQEKKFRVCVCCLLGPSIRVSRSCVF